jgi:uncharacterized glyoxalase superfamily protein PhnB
MLVAADLRQTIDWYTGVLGFEIENQLPEERPAWCSLSRDDVEIMFMADPESAAARPRLSGVLYVNTDDVLGLYERIKDRVKVLWGPEVYHYGMHEFAIEDCNGYRISFGQPTDAAPSCPADLV